MSKYYENVCVSCTNVFISGHLFIGIIDFHHNKLKYVGKLNPASFYLFCTRSNVPVTHVFTLALWRESLGNIAGDGYFSSRYSMIGIYKYESH